MTTTLDLLTEEQITAKLASARGRKRERPFPPGFLPPNPRPAAVLIPFLRSDGHWHLLLTRRTSHLPEHSGQVAFPGGRTDPEDLYPEATALREAHEEIGIKPDDVRILGKMRPLKTITNYIVTPVIGVIPWPYQFEVQADEVDRVFTIPLPWLADPRNREIQMRALQHPYPPIPVVYFKTYDGELLWGVSAALTSELISILD